MKPLSDDVEASSYSRDDRNTPYSVDGNGDCTIDGGSGPALNLSDKLSNKYPWTPPNDSNYDVMEPIETCVVNPNPESCDIGSHNPNGVNAILRESFRDSLSSSRSNTPEKWVDVEDTYEGRDNTGSIIDEAFTGAIPQFPVDSKILDSPSPKEKVAGQNELFELGRPSSKDNSSNVYESFKDDWKPLMENEQLSKSTPKTDPSTTNNANMDIFSKQQRVESNIKSTMDREYTQDTKLKTISNEAEFHDDANLLQDTGNNSSTYLDETVDSSAKDKKDREGKAMKEERLKLYHSYCSASQFRNNDDVCKDDDTNGKDNMDDNPQRSYGTLHGECDDNLVKMVNSPEENSKWQSESYFTCCSREESSPQGKDESIDTRIFDTIEFDTATNITEILTETGKKCNRSNEDSTESSSPIKQLSSERGKTKRRRGVVKDRAASDTRENKKIPCIKPIPPEKVLAYLRSFPNSKDSRIKMFDIPNDATGDFDIRHDIDGLSSTEDAHLCKQEQEIPNSQKQLPQSDDKCYLAPNSVKSDLRGLRENEPPNFNDSSIEPETRGLLGEKLMEWVTNLIFSKSTDVCSSMYDKALRASEYGKGEENAMIHLSSLLEEFDTINIICEYVVECLGKAMKPEKKEPNNIKLESDVISENKTEVLSDDGFSSTLKSSIVMENAVVSLLRSNDDLKPFSMSSSLCSDEPASTAQVATFVSFLQKISYVSGIKLPFKKNRYSEEIVQSSLSNNGHYMLFGSDRETQSSILNFLYEASIVRSLTTTKNRETQTSEDCLTSHFDRDSSTSRNEDFLVERQRLDSKPSDNTSLLTERNLRQAEKINLEKESKNRDLRQYYERPDNSSKNVIKESNFGETSGFVGSFDMVNNSLVDDGSDTGSEATCSNQQESLDKLVGCESVGVCVDRTLDVRVKELHNKFNANVDVVKHEKDMALLAKDIQKSVKEKSIRLLTEDNPPRDQILYDIAPDETCTTSIACCHVIDVLTSNISKKATTNKTILKTDETTDRKLLSLNYYIIPRTTPSPFEIAAWNIPSIVSLFIAYLGDPVAVCKMKMVNKFCNRLITANEYAIMKDSVCAGGINPKQRPAFWLWLTLERYKTDEDYVIEESTSVDLNKIDADYSEKPELTNFLELEKVGREGKWHHCIRKDVRRAFGDMPPHNSSMKSKSIVRALVAWGQGHLARTNVNRACNLMSPCSVDSEKEKPLRRLTVSPPIRNRKNFKTQSTTSDERVDSFSISPVGSNASSDIFRSHSNQSYHCIDTDLALSGNSLTKDMKLDLQNKLECILHAIAAAHPGFGYCQGIDYIVAHLLRSLQATIKMNASRGKLPSSIQSAKKYTGQTATTVDSAPVVEEAIFRVMDTLLTKYNLRHMYWPGLRCLMTCCRVFERIIEMKLPVLADHFEHHEVNVRHFAQGWFHTLYFYIPSMPAATINHMWDIWLVERSMKIFFRVGTAILFLSQPILLNNEFDGMMMYLRHLPDATLLNPDILLKCALQIKITNKMLTQIEMEVVQENDRAHGWDQRKIDERYHNIF